MKNLNKITEFDQQWKNAFSDAEKAPPEGMWDKIDSQLSKEEAGYFKKRAFLFKLMAAASIAFALVIGSFSINHYLNQNDDNVVVEQLSENKSSEQLSQLPGQMDEIEKDGNSRIGDEISSTELLDKNIPASNAGDRKVDHTFIVLNEDNDSDHELVSEGIIEGQDDANNGMEYNSGHQTRSMTEFSELFGKGINTSSEDEMIHTIDHIYLIPIMPRGASKNKKVRESGGFLAGLDFSTGLFDPNFEQGNNVFASTAGANIAGARVESVNDQLAPFNATNKDFLLVRSAGQETKADVSYSYGANFGFKVSRRIILQTGLSYRKSNATTTTTGYIQDAESNAQIPIVAAYQYQLSGLSTVKRVDETSLNNQYEFASIPLRAGYILLDKKINLTFLAGISSELFLNNQIGSTENDFQTLSSSAGDASPYKSVYFNGSLGTMFGYSFAKNYLITVEPSYRFAVNSFTRNDFYLNSYPSSFMVSFGVAYSFK